MMKRTGVPRGPDEPAPQGLPQQMQQAAASTMHNLSQSGTPFQILGTNPNVSNASAVRGARAPPVINYLKAGTQYKQPPHQTHQPPRIKFGLSQSSLPLQSPLDRQSPAPLAAPLATPLVTPLPAQMPAQIASQGNTGPPQIPPNAPAAAGQFQRLKVEDALSYLDQVKYKFNTQPQVYNDFLDIMKEFKSQTIDTPGVITRVSNLFKGHPELIVGFNTFLPPGYKIEVQSNGQVSVSMPSPLEVHVLPPQVHILPVAPSVQTIVHNLSVNPSVNNTLHHISQAHQQIEAASIHHQQQGSQPLGHPPIAAAGQPVEFNHAIEYVNKIKSRFSRQPDKYKRFLEILHAYQRGHRDLKEPLAKQQTEQEVYSQVAKLFENQEDLLAEFGQFLPDAKAVTKPNYQPARHEVDHQPNQRECETERYNMGGSAPAEEHPLHHPHHQISKHQAAPVNVAPAPQHHLLKRSPSFSSNISSGAPPPKKNRLSIPPILRDVSYAEAAKLATAHDYSFFDKARKALSETQVYDNFLRCLLLFTQEVISSGELLIVVAPFLCRHPDLQKWLHDFLLPHTTATGVPRSTSPIRSYEPLGAPAAQLRLDRPQGDAAMDIDLTTCKRLGTSYCALPREAAARKCSGRTALCKEVLNDTWVSFPTWSEDSTFVTSRKTQYEEYIYRCEDERFELDVVIETNASTIQVLEGVSKKLSRMSVLEAAKYRLDDNLGGHSATIHQRAIRRIYGDKAVDIIAGLKKNPVVAVPVVLRRLKAKEEEWREAQKGFNKQWREQNEKYYLKSLDHQGINFKQNDLKAWRSKCLFNEVESAYAARRPPPHVTVDYGTTNRQEAIKILRDAADLLIHHARRQTAIQKVEKRRIKQLLRQFLPDLFNHPRQPLSDDERDDDERDEPMSPGSPEQTDKDGDKSHLKTEKQESSESDNASDKSSKNHKNDKENKPKNNNLTEAKETIANNVKRSSSNEGSVKSEVKQEDLEDDFRDHPPNESRFVCTSSWYLFLRVHAALCQRLVGALKAATHLADDAAAASASASPADNTKAKALRLKPNNLPACVSSPKEYYSVILELVKSVLDGNMEASAYEDATREMLGIKAYPAYTLDKLVSIGVRQLQHCVCESWSWRCAVSRAKGESRQQELHTLRKLRPHHTAFLVQLYGGEECKVSFELLEGAGEGRTSPQHNNDGNRLSPTHQSVSRPNPSEAVSRLAAWALYRDSYARPDRIHKPRPVFLRRNARKCGVYGANSADSSCDLPTVRRQRKPRLHDQTECTLSSTIRLIASRPHQLYRPGSLSSAKSSQTRLHAARRAKFRAWLAHKHEPKL